MSKRRPWRALTGSCFRADRPWLQSRALAATSSFFRVERPHIPRFLLNRASPAREDYLFAKSRSFCARSAPARPASETWRIAGASWVDG
jgi:hypothetical protein